MRQPGAERSLPLVVRWRDGGVGRLAWLLSRGNGTGSLRGAPRAHCLEESSHGKPSRFGCWCEEERVVRGVEGCDVGADAESSSDGNEPVGDRRVAAVAGRWPGGVGGGRGGVGRVEGWFGGGSAVVVAGARAWQARARGDGDGDAPAAGVWGLQQGQDL